MNIRDVPEFTSVVLWVLKSHSGLRRNIDSGRMLFDTALFYRVIARRRLRLPPALASSSKNWL
jgi:hypothetical protein